MADREIALKIAVKDFNVATKALRDLGPAGEASFTQIVSGSNRASAALDTLDKRFQGANRWAGSGGAFQQLGYQVGDFAVQVQGGTSAVTAFIQQGSQIAGAFGPVGAVVGAAGAVVGALATSLLRSGQEAETTQSKLDDLTQSTDEYRKRLEEIVPLQKAFLENLNAQTTASQGAEQARQQASQRLNESRPQFVAGRLKEPTYDELVGQVAPLLPNGGLSASQVARQQLIRDRAREDQAIDEYLNRTLTQSVGKFEAKPGEQAREEVIEANRKAAEEAKKAATEREQAAKKGAALLEQIKAEAEATKGLADATELGTAAVKRQQIANDDAKRVLEASHTLKGQELEDYKKSSAAIAENERRILALNEATKAELALAQERIDRAPASMGGFYDTKYSGKSVNNPAVDAPYKDPEAERYADLQRDILIRPWQDMASEVTSINRQMFDDLLTDGKASIGDIAKGFGDVVKQTITGTASNLVMMPVNTAISQVASEAMKPGGDFFSSAKQFGSAHPYMASGALGATGGYLAGSLYGQLTGKQDTYASTGGAVGGGAGAIAGFALGNLIAPGVGGVPGAMLGGLLGSAGGSFLGGLFGGKTGNDASNQDYWTTKGKITYSDSSYSPENRAITSGLGGQLAALQESLGGLGATFTDVGIKLSAGNKSGITVNGTKYGSQEEALPAALRLLLDSAGGLSGSQQTAAQNTKGRTVQEVLGDVQFAKEFDKITFAGTEFEAALRDLNERFDETARRAHDLGLNEQALADARAKAVERLQTEKARQDRDLDVSVLNAIEGDSLQSAVRSLDNGFAQLIDRMTDAGYSSESLAAAEAARVRQQDELVKQYGDQAKGLQEQLDQQVRGVQGYFEGLINPLKSIVANDNRLSPIGQIEQARKTFQETLGLAQGGDVKAIQELSGAAQNLQGLSSRYLGSGGLGADINREVTSGASGILSTLEQQRAETLASLPQVQRETVAEQIRQSKEDTAAIVDGLARILRGLENLRPAA